MSNPSATIKPRRIAVVLNGDTEDHHRHNVKLSVEALKADGFEVFVASTENPGVSSDHYVAANKNNISALLNHLKKTGRTSDELVIYTTGHGSISVDDEVIALPGHKNHKALGKQLDSIPYGKRTVVMDQCFGGNSTKRFLNDPRTLFISAGNADETVKCQEFAPYFWAPKANVPDRNHDTHITWDERFGYMKGHFAWGSQPLYLASAGYALSGMPQRGAFENKVIVVNSQADLNQQLARLKKDGEYAVITFSATWCGPCKKYRPEFEKMAKAAGGHVLFLRTENEALAGQYGVTGFPTIKAMNRDGDHWTIENRDAVLEEVAAIASPKSIVDVIKRKIVAAGETYDYLKKRATVLVITKALDDVMAAQKLPPSHERDAALHKTIEKYLKATLKPARSSSLVFPILNQIGDPKIQGKCRELVYAKIAEAARESSGSGYPSVMRDVINNAEVLHTLHSDTVKSELLESILTNEDLWTMSPEEAAHYLAAAHSIRNPEVKTSKVLQIAGRLLKQGQYEAVANAIRSIYPVIVSQNDVNGFRTISMFWNKMGDVGNEVGSFNEAIAAARQSARAFDELCHLYSIASTRSVNKVFSAQTNRAFLSIEETLYTELLALAVKQGGSAVEHVKEMRVSYLTPQ